MSELSIEERLRALENDVAELKRHLGLPSKPWWQEISGVFAGDKAFLEAMKLGREWRESLRPKKRRTKRKASRSRKKK
jgi:hypothetical protein